MTRNRKPSAVGAAEGPGEVESKHPDSAACDLSRQVGPLLGEQLTLLPLPEFNPAMPRPATLAERLLDCMLAGESLTHPEWEDRTQSWRLAATVQTLRDYGWPVQTLPIPAPTPENPERFIARYWLRSDAIAKGRELRRGVTV